MLAVAQVPFSLMRFNSVVAAVVGLVLSGFSSGNAVVVPVNKPFQVVRPSKDHTSIEVVHEGLAKLQQHAGNIALISVVGPYHSGKSFLLNSLLGDPSVFAVGPRTSPETMGMWMCRTNLTAVDGSEIWLMDSEGFFGPGISQAYDAKVFTVSSLLGAHVVYNTVKVIDQQAVNLLEVLVQQAQLFRSRSAVFAEPVVGVPEFLATSSLPPFTWVVEDFVQELPNIFQNGGAVSLSGYLSESSSDMGAEVVSEAGNSASFLEKLYSDVRVHPLFLPATNKAQLQDLSRLRWEDLTEEFRSEIGSLRKHLLANIEARRFNGKTASGTVVAQALHFALQALQQGKFGELPSLWKSWTAQVAQMSLQDASLLFRAEIRTVDTEEHPVELKVFNSRLEQARRKSLAFYNQLIKDFDVKGREAELIKQMDADLLQGLVPLYTERVRGWAANLVTRAKDRMERHLNIQVLPMDPAVLEVMSRDALDQAVKNFTERFDNFKAPGPVPKVGVVVAMPQFAQDPIVQLRSDLKALVGLRSSENEKEVQRLLKAAENAAAEVVTRELKNRGSALFGKAQMQEIHKSINRACWEAFDAQLAKQGWVSSVDSYKATRALVKAEYYEGPLNRFTAAHDNRLSEYMRGGLERAIAGYKGSRSKMSMPVAEAELEVEHLQLAKKAQEILTLHASGTDDTDAFIDAAQRFKAVLAEGFHQSREKNIALWKAHADDATRCAAAANREAERRCGTICAFSTIPWMHRATSKRHLSNCFSSSSSGSQMSPSLQAKVFEMWYTQDMGAAARSTRQRFYMFLVVVVVAVIAMWWKRSSAGMQKGYPGQFQDGLQDSFYQTPCYEQPMDAGFGMPGIARRRLVR